MMWTWLKKKFSRKPEAVMPSPSVTRPLAPSHRTPMPTRAPVQRSVVSEDRATIFEYSNPTPVFSFDTGREASIPLPQDRVEVDLPKYEPAPVRELVANFTYTEPSSSYESSSYCDSSSSDSGSSCSSD